MQVFFVTCILLGLQSSVLGACSPNTAVLSNDFLQPHHNNGSTYYVSKAVYTTDMAALEECQKICGYLVEVGNDAELDFLKTIMNTDNIDIMLIAGTDKAEEGKWVYQRTGEIMPFTHWHSGEPNNVYGAENCICLFRHLDGMYDLSCQLFTWKPKFMCEIK